MVASLDDNVFQSSLVKVHLRINGIGIGPAEYDLAQLCRTILFKSRFLSHLCESLLACSSSGHDVVNIEDNHMRSTPPHSVLLSSFA